MLFAGSSAAAANISYKGVARAFATSVTLPSHATDDMIVMLAGGFYDATQITIPSGWTEITKILDDPSNYQAILAYKVAASGGETSGTWTGASQVNAVVWDGVASIGGSSSQKSTGSTVYWPAVTMSVSGGSSWVAGLIIALGDSTGIATAPTGMTNRSSGSLSANHDTASGVSSWSQKTTTMGLTGNRYVFTFELVAE